MKPTCDFGQLGTQIKTWGRELGFQQIGITDTDLSAVEPKLHTWLSQHYHGNMRYMAAHELKRSRPDALLPGTIRIITARMDYLPADPQFHKVLNDPHKGFISRYAQGRDYHRLIRKRLGQLAARSEETVGQFNYRAFADSAPVMEKPLAEKAGLGWQGKHTNLINSKAGSWFFLGTLFTDLPLPIDAPQAQSHCGSCTRCIEICPTQAIVAPYQLDARRCISYLTIELREAIPIEFRKMIGNRIYGCDDCQLVCPWNKFAKTAAEIAFHADRGLKNPDLTELFSWTETEFLQRTEGSAIRRIGYECWLRNIAVALGNAPSSPEVITALRSRVNEPSALVREHVEWALIQHQKLTR